MPPHITMRSRVSYRVVLFRELTDSIFRCRLFCHLHEIYFIPLHFEPHARLSLPTSDACLRYALKLTPA